MRRQYPVFFEFARGILSKIDDGDIEKIDGILNKYPYHFYNFEYYDQE